MSFTWRRAACLLLLTVAAAAGSTFALRALARRREVDGLPVRLSLRARLLAWRLDRRSDREANMRLYEITWHHPSSEPPTLEEVHQAGRLVLAPGDALEVRDGGQLWLGPGTGIVALDYGGATIGRVVHVTEDPD